MHGHDSKILTGESRMEKFTIVHLTTDVSLLGDLRLPLAQRLAQRDVAVMIARVRHARDACVKPGSL